MAPEKPMPQARVMRFESDAICNSVTNFLRALCGSQMQGDSVGHSAKIGRRGSGLTHYADGVLSGALITAISMQAAILQSGICPSTVLTFPFLVPREGFK